MHVEIYSPGTKKLPFDKFLDEFKKYHILSVWLGMGGIIEHYFIFDIYADQTLLVYPIPEVGFGVDPEVKPLKLHYDDIDGIDVNKTTTPTESSNVVNYHKGLLEFLSIQDIGYKHPCFVYKNKVYVVNKDWVSEDSKHITFHQDGDKTDIITVNMAYMRHYPFNWLPYNKKVNPFA